MRLRYGKGAGSIEVKGDLKKTILKALRNSNRILLDAMEEELTKIEKNAVKNWPVRQKKYGKSKDSRSKFTKGFRILPPTTVEAFIRNSAEYAYAIRAGKSSTTNVKEGERVAVKLVFDPTEEAAERILKKVADSMMDLLR